MTERERLIELIKSLSCGGQPDSECLNLTYDDCKKCGRIGIEAEDVEKLADNLLANGVIVPPCKVGDVVYKPIITDDTHEPAIWDITISQISIEKGKLQNEAYAIGTICKSESGISFDFNDIGKTVFFTKEEAEAALKGGAE